MKKVNPNVGVKTRYQVDLGAMIMEEIHEVDNHKPGGNETLNLFESRYDFRLDPLLLSFRKATLIPESAQSICVLCPHL